MDAKDRLRLYLEQRRELGESELVLDALPVEDVLRMIGAPKSSAPQAPSKTNTTTELANSDPSQTALRPDIVVQSPPPILPPTYAPPPPPPSLRTNEASSANWRDVLQSAANPASQPLQRAAIPVPPAIPAWLSALGIPVGLFAVSAVAASDIETLADLSAVAARIAGCRACALGATALNPVPGEGNAAADFVCVGEAPGQNEDESGRPFVGAAGQLLTKILAAIQLPREDVFICNVLKHRPPGNRNPAPEEVRACTPYLTRQLELIKPKVILALGTFAAQTLLNTDIGLGKLRGQVHSYQGIPLIVTYHPAALLRNESWKRPAWDDVKLARRILDAARASDSNGN